jgi:hypothetical protein
MVVLLTDNYSVDKKIFSIPLKWRGRSAKFVFYLNSVEINKHSSPKGEVLIIPVPKNLKGVSNNIYESILNRHATLQMSKLLRVIDINTPKMRKFINNIMVNCGEKELKFKSPDDMEVEIFSTFDDLKDIDVDGYPLPIDFQERLDILRNKKFFPFDTYFVAVKFKTTLLNSGIGVVYFDDKLDYWYYPMTCENSESINSRLPHQLLFNIKVYDCYARIKKWFFLYKDNHTFYNQKFKQFNNKEKLLQMLENFELKFIPFNDNNHKELTAKIFLETRREEDLTQEEIEELKKKEYMNKEKSQDESRTIREIYEKDNMTYYEKNIVEKEMVKLETEAKFHKQGEEVILGAILNPIDEITGEEEFTLNINEISLFINHAHVNNYYFNQNILYSKQLTTAEKPPSLQMEIDEYWSNKRERIRKKDEEEEKKQEIEFTSLTPEQRQAILTKRIIDSEVASLQNPFGTTRQKKEPITFEPDPTILKNDFARQPDF